MQPLPQLETCLRLAFDARDPSHPSGVALASYFARAPMRGRRRADLEFDLLFSSAVRTRLGTDPDSAIAQAMDPGSWRSCPSARPTVPLATREWLGGAGLGLGRKEGVPLLWGQVRGGAGAGGG